MPASQPDLSPFRLDGTHALITGAGSGIGKAVAAVLAAEGAAVAINDIDPGAAASTVTELAALGLAAVTVPGDAADQAGASAVVGAALEKLDSLQILVNNASSWVDLRSFTDLEQQDIQASMSSFYAALYITRAALAHLESGARIVNITSIAATLGADQMSVYGAAKAAIHGLSAGLAKELAPRQITVNCVAPGLIDTPRQRRRPRDVVRQRVASVPIGRAGTPEEVAYAVLYLVSPQAAYVTGEVLAVDGGRP